MSLVKSVILSVWHLECLLVYLSVNWSNYWLFSQKLNWSINEAPIIAFSYLSTWSIGQPIFEFMAEPISQRVSLSFSKIISLSIENKAQFVR